MADTAKAEPKQPDAGVNSTPEGTSLQERGEQLVDKGFNLSLIHI